MVEHKDNTTPTGHAITRAEPSDICECVILLSGNYYVFPIATKDIPGFDSVIFNCSRTGDLLTINVPPYFGKIRGHAILGWYFRASRKGLVETMVEKQIEVLDATKREMAKGEEWRDPDR